MVMGGIKEDRPSEALVASSGKTHPEDVQGRGGNGGGGVGNNGFPPKM